MHRQIALEEVTSDELIGSGGNYGAFMSAQGKIKYTKLDATETVDTIVHELLHGIFYAMQLKNAYIHLDPENELEEKLIRPLSTGLVTLMTDNPELMTRLIELTKLGNSRETNK